MVWLTVNNQLHELADGQLFVTFQTPPVFLNRITRPHRDAVTGTPEDTVTSVTVERASR